MTTLMDNVERARARARAYGYPFFRGTILYTRVY